MCFAAFYVWNLKFTFFSQQMRRDVDGDDDDVKL